MVFVILLPILVTNQLGMGDPFFCKYLCPQGVLEGALPLSIANAGIRAALGKLFTWKAGILVAVVLLSLMFYRPFCKWICPLGAVYALFNKVSLLQMHIDTGKCVSCGKCAGVCKMDVDVVRHPMLMYSKEANNRKQEIDRQHHTIPNQRANDKHHGNVYNLLFRYGKVRSQNMEKLKSSFPTFCKRTFPQLHKIASYAHYAQCRLLRKPSHFIIYSRK